MKIAKKILILVLCLGVLGISIGLSAFSSNLNIKTSTTVTPDSSNFKLIVSGSGTDSSVSTIAPFHDKTTGTVANIIQNNNTATITNVHATFTEPNAHISYYIYIYNVGQYDGYLKSAKFNNIEGFDNHVKCTAREGTTNELVQEACKCIRPVLYLNPKGKGWGPYTNWSGSELLAKGSSAYEIPFRIYYDDTCTTFADGPFDIEIGDAEITFSTAP